MTEPYCMILTTTSSKDEAGNLAEMLVSRRLAACVQIINIASVYAWQGIITKDVEFLLLIKTAAHLYPAVETALLKNHSYEVPEIIQIPVTRGLPAYLAWIEENTISP